MQNPSPVQTATKSSTGLDENIAALLSYVFGWVSGLIFFLIEKDSRLVRFHAMQSILLNAAALVVGIVLWFAWMIIALIFSQISDVLAGLVSFVLGLLILVFYIGLLIAVVFCLIKAYQKQYFKLPVLGNFAEKFSAK
ncbi:MAG TPA: DUF4870 domain-containing protein [Pyrinomonadaceae bacterium]|jgi:uncharacterized membrane protein|nr:DUF4870 domain-containing protein [Pyrinomonadaceae bacterium]